MFGCVCCVLCAVQCASLIWFLMHDTITNTTFVQSCRAHHRKKPNITREGQDEVNEDENEEDEIRTTTKWRKIQRRKLLHVYSGKKVLQRTVFTVSLVADMLSPYIFHTHGNLFHHFPVCFVCRLMMLMVLWLCSAPMDHHHFTIKIPDQIHKCERVCVFHEND